MKLSFQNLFINHTTDMQTGKEDASSLMQVNGESFQSLLDRQQSDKEGLDMKMQEQGMLLCHPMYASMPFAELPALNTMPGQVEKDTGISLTEGITYHTVSGQLPIKQEQLNGMLQILETNPVIQSVLSQPEMEEGQRLQTKHMLPEAGKAQLEGALLQEENPLTNLVSPKGEKESVIAPPLQGGKADGTKLSAEGTFLQKENPLNDQAMMTGEKVILTKQPTETEKPDLSEMLGSRENPLTDPTLQEGEKHPVRKSPLQEDKEQRITFLAEGTERNSNNGHHTSAGEPEANQTTYTLDPASTIVMQHTSNVAAATKEVPKLQWNASTESIKELASYIEKTIASQQKEIAVELEPEHLGRIILRASMDSGEAVVEITCFTEQAKESLAKCVSDIGSLLQNRMGGETIIHVDAEPEDQWNPYQDSEQGNRKQQREQKQSSKQEKRYDYESDFLQQLRLGIT